MRLNYCLRDFSSVVKVPDDVELERDRFFSDDVLELTLGSVSYTQKRV